MPEKDVVSSEELAAMQKKISESFEALAKTSNSVFLVITISLFLISALLIVQVAFSVFNLKTKPLPPPPAKVIVQKKKKRGSSSKRSRRHRSSKRSSRSLKKTRPTQLISKNYPSKTATLQVEFDNREKKEKVEKMEPVFRAPTAQLPGYSNETPKVDPRQSDTSGLESLDVTQKSSPLPKSATPMAAPKVEPIPSTYAMDAAPAPQQPVQAATSQTATAQATNSWYLMHPIYGAGIKSEPLVYTTPPVNTPKDVKKP